MRSRALVAAAAVLGTVSLAAPQAVADVGVLSSTQWTRSCGTTYSGVSSAATDYANTRKHSGGSCKGDAWLRIQVGGVWQSWRHHSSLVEARSPYMTAAQHKGCADCAVYTTYP
ncbi:hypothetical protein [Actinokineospora iranica]|uniref:Bacteriocin (Lactococcin_972) n=1 Tax=Actinokineospora iranica TaxID=1271860 RepID=A0A1G6S7G3_9PSEU|nr:hypothetical protein [Actinokineospora iranica]SDD12862.1 hypothetical protein SAMN05216174_107273 [Actinokineospora iranica]